MTTLLPFMLILFAINKQIKILFNQLFYVGVLGLLLLTLYADEKGKKKYFACLKALILLGLAVFFNKFSRNSLKVAAIVALTGCSSSGYY